MKIKVKVPKKIKIGAHKACLKVVKYSRCDDNYRAYYHERKGEMGFDWQLSPIQRDRDLGHEVTHMIDVDKMCNLSEENISRIGNGWIEFLRDNLGIELDWSDIK